MNSHVQAEGRALTLISCAHRMHFEPARDCHLGEESKVHRGLRITGDCLVFCLPLQFLQAAQPVVVRPQGKYGPRIRNGVVHLQLWETIAAIEPGVVKLVPLVQEEQHTRHLHARSMHRLLK